MDEVLGAFGAHYPGAIPGEAGARARLSAAIDEAYGAARGTWPGVDVPAARFAAELGKRVRLEELDALDVARAVARLATSDLYLAIGCADRDPAALTELERSFMPELRGALERMRFPSSTVDEALQTARIGLLVGDESGAPRMLEYGARGQLRGWLRVVVSRIAYKIARASGPAPPAEDVLVEGGVHDMELDLLQKTYGDTFKAAFRVSMAGLSVRDRVLLKQRYAMQMTVVALGAQHGVNASTVSRWVTDARERLVLATRAEMMARLRLGPAEVSSILRLIDLEMDTSLLAYREPSRS